MRGYMCAWAHTHTHIHTPCFVETHPNDSWPCTFSSEVTMLLYVEHIYSVSLSACVSPHECVYRMWEISSSIKSRKLSNAFFRALMLLHPCSFSLPLSTSSTSVCSYSNPLYVLYVYFPMTSAPPLQFPCERLCN